MAEHTTSGNSSQKTYRTKDHVNHVNGELINGVICGIQYKDDNSIQYYYVAFSNKKGIHPYKPEELKDG